MNRVITGLVVLVGALVAFYVGAKYGEAHSSTSASVTASPAPGAGVGARTGASPGAGGRGGVFATPAASGQIVAAANGIITVQDRQTGKEVKVNVGSARITKTTQGTAADLTQNAVVTVTGQKAADGTVNAQAIAIGGGLGGGGRLRPSPST
ncbi:MAG: hypothetical protein M3170_03720 [Candidatus Dormibacteraeota bacterium]|nr:hypothetical protein [Candidatus Dormibacteraeota bacterium]MDQ6920688.1 hypothetical protein [Candidatus Dormibacteraeota bacterium]